MGVGEEIHIRMKNVTLQNFENKYVFCGKKIGGYDMNWVTKDFYLPGNIMCSICVDEWENEDIRMITPTKNKQ